MKHFNRLASLTGKQMLSDVYPSSQSDDGESSVVYNTVGSNVCMGDHKVSVAHLNHTNHFM